MGSARLTLTWLAAAVVLAGAPAGAWTAVVVDPEPAEYVALPGEGHDP